MGKPRWTAKAQDIPHIVRYRIANFSDGDGIKFTINSKYVQVFYDEDSDDTFVEQIVDAWNASISPEIAEITASVDADDGDVLVLTHDTPGWEFTITTGVTNATNTSNVVETVKGSPLVNEVQKLELIGTYTGGTFTYTNDFGSGNETTGNIDFDATAAEVQTAILALATPVSGDLSVSGVAGGPWFLTWQGAFEAAEVAEGTIDGTNLTGNAAIQVETITQGHGLSDEIQILQVRDGTLATGSYSYKLRFGGQTTSALTEDSDASAVQAALEALSSIGSGNVAVYGGRSGNSFGAGNHYLFAIHFKGNLAETNVAMLESVDQLSCINLAWIIQHGGESTRDEVQVINLGLPSGGTFTLTYGSETTGDLSYTASKDQVESQIEALTAFDTVEVNSALSSSQISATGVYIVRFRGASADTDVVTPTLNSGSLTGATSPSVATIADGGASQNEVQSIIIGGSGGTFTLTFDGQTTSSLTFGDSAATIDAALEALSNIPAGGVGVTGAGTPASPYIVTFTGGLAGTDVAEITGDATSLTGGAGIVTEITGHAAAVDEQQVITIDPNATGGEFRLTFDDQTTSWLPYNASSTVVEAALDGLTTIPGVTVSGSAGGPYTVTFDTGSLSEIDVELIVIDASRLTLAASDENVSETIYQHATGKNWWNNSDNWENLGDAPIPEFGDEVNIDIGDNANSPKFGIQQRSAFTADAGTDFVTFTRVDFVEGQKIQLTTTNTLPAGLSLATDYFVLSYNHEAQTAQLSATRGGAAIDITDAGTGIHTAKVVLARLFEPSSFEGEVGLPEINSEADDYLEYRPRFLQIGIVELVVGGGSGNGSPGTRIELGDDDTMTLALIGGTGSPQTSEHALTIQGGTITEVAFNAGSVAIAPKKRVASGNSCVVTTLRQGYQNNIETDTDLYVGEEATIATFVKTGGVAEVRCPITTSARQSGGEADFNGESALAQLYVQGGEFRYNSTGTLGGNTVVSGDGHLDFSRDLRTKTVTNPIERFGEDSRISDPHKVVASLVIDNNETEDLANLRIGRNARITRGAVA